MIDKIKEKLQVYGVLIASFIGMLLTISTVLVIGASPQEPVFWLLHSIMFLFIGVQVAFGIYINLLIKRTKELIKLFEEEEE